MRLYGQTLIKHTKFRLHRHIKDYDLPSTLYIVDNHYMAEKEIF